MTPIIIAAMLDYRVENIPVSSNGRDLCQSDANGTTYMCQKQRL